MRENLPKRKAAVKINLAKTGSGGYPTVMLWLRGPEITELRHALEMNLREFGEYLGVAEGTVCRWEADLRRPRIEMMERLNKELAGTRNGRRKTAGAV